MRVHDNAARLFYLKECIECQWSVRQLDRNISTMYYQRILSSQPITREHNQMDIDSIHSFIKDPYIMESLGLPSASDYNEHDLENALIVNLQKFLLENWEKGSRLWVGNIESVQRLRISTLTLYSTITF